MTRKEKNLRKAIEKKEVIVSEIKEKFEKSTSAVLVDYLGLTVEESTELRNNLREANIDYKIYKNTLIKRAIDGTDFNELEGFLKGSTALAFSYDDVTAPVRIINNAIKAYGKMAFKAGTIEGEHYDAEKIRELASIPAREVLLAKLLGSFKAPIGAFARVVNAIAEERGGGEAPAPESAADAPAEAKVAAEPAKEETKPAEPLKEEPAAEEAAEAAEPAKEEIKPAEVEKTEEAEPEEVVKEEVKPEETEEKKVEEKKEEE